MYFFLTNHCKMECDHCCVSASPRGKKYMSKRVFMAGLELAEQIGHGVFLGGGEPTDHPRFLYFLMEVLSSNVEIETSGVITNGSNEKLAILLSRLSNCFYVNLSLDIFHDPDLVSENVRLAFGDNQIRKNPHRIIKQGRGKNIFGSKKGCCCSDLWMNWNGDLYHCGCKKRKYGNIITGHNLYDFNEILLGECSEQ